MVLILSPGLPAVLPRVRYEIFLVSRTAFRVLAIAMMLVFMVGCVIASNTPATDGTGTTGERSQLSRRVPGEVLVQFQPDTSDSRIKEILQSAGIHAMESLGMPQVYVLKFPGEIPVEEIIRRLKVFPEVRHAEPNRLTPLNPAPKPR